MKLLLGRTGDGWIEIHRVAAFIMAWWSVMLFTGSATFDVGGAFEAMAALGSERNWAIGFAIVSGIGIWGLYSEQVMVRRFSSALVTVGHLWIAALSVSSGGLTTGTGTYAAVAWLTVSRLRMQCSEERPYADRV